MVVQPRTPRSIALFRRDAASRIQAITEKYELRGDPGLDVALAAIYFSHQELWNPNAQGAKASTRAAGKINFATKKFMSLLSRNVTTVAHLLTAAAAPTDDLRLAMGEISILTLTLRRLLFNSHVAKRAKSARGRGKDPLAVTVAVELGRRYDNWCPPSSRRMPRGESRSNIRARFVREAASMLGVRLTLESIRTYGEKKHMRRVRS